MKKFVKCEKNNLASADEQHAGFSGCEKKKWKIAINRIVVLLKRAAFVERWNKNIAIDYDVMILVLNMLVFAYRKRARFYKNNIFI